MDIFTSAAPSLPEFAKLCGRNTVDTINSKPHWEALIPPAPHFFHGASDSVEVSPPIYKYCPGGFDNQTIGCCVGKSSKNGAGTVLRIPAGAVWDPKDPTNYTKPASTVACQARLSGLYCYYNARNVHGRSGFGEGAVVAYSLDAMMKYGVIPESMWPDTPANQSAYSDRRPPSDTDYAEGVKHAIVHAARITSKQQFFDFPAQGFPLIFGVPIGAQWTQTADDGKFGLGGRTIGGHAIVFVGYDRKLNRAYIRNSWCLANWGARTDDPEFNSDDPALGGNAKGVSNIGYCPLDQFEDMYLDDRSLSNGSTDAFVINDVPNFAAPKIAPISQVEMFT